MIPSLVSVQCSWVIFFCQFQGAPSRLGVRQDGQEVRGGVLPAGLLAPHGLAAGAQAHEHRLLLVPPLG